MRKIYLSACRIAQHVTEKTHAFLRAPKDPIEENGRYPDTPEYGGDRYDSFGFPL